MDSLPVNIVDICVGVVLLLSALLAYARGFVHEVLSVGGWIGAIFATIYGYPYLRPYAHELISIEIAADLTVGIGLFVVTLMVLSLLTRAIAKGVQASALNALDRSLGFLFGVARGAVLICLVYIGVEWMLPPDEQPEWMTTARAMPLIREGAAFVITLVPEDAREQSAETAGEAAEQTRKLLETQKTLHDMLNVEPKGTDAAPTNGYDKRTRSGIERLIDNSQ
jgi:membrane protein required for colicin V production